MSAIKLNSSGGGSITISPASTASTLTLTAPANTGVLSVDGPAFAAYQTSPQAVTGGAFFKLVLNAEEYDTDNCFDSTTNYRFTPNKAGIYLITGVVTRAVTNCDMSLNIYKNGSNFCYGNTIYASGAGSTTVSRMMYMNGTTDYVEFYGYFSVSQNTVGTQLGVNAQGCFLRAL